MDGRWDSHVVSSDDVESQNHLLHALTGAEHPLVALIQDQVDGLIEALQSALNKQTNKQTASSFRGDAFKESGNIQQINIHTVC